MNEQKNVNREFRQTIQTVCNSDSNKEQGSNPRPANWPAPPQDKVDRITKGIPTSPVKPKP